MPWHATTMIFDFGRARSGIMPGRAAAAVFKAVRRASPDRFNRPSGELAAILHG